MGEGGTQSNKVHKFALNEVSVSTVLSKIVGLTSRQCDQGSNQGPGVICGLSLLLNQFLEMHTGFPQKHIRVPILREKQ